jgi:L-alanine-DL-glutamate epimerase-like enolase superfamily enzyme
MLISHVAARLVRVPVARPTRMATRVLRQRDYVLVTIRADGVEGVGYCYAGTSGGEVVREAIRSDLAAVLVGADAEDIAGTWDRMYQETLLSGRRGAVLRAMSAIDVALWDLLGQRCGLPLAVVLGGGRGPVAAYASGGYYRPEDHVTAAEQVAAEIRDNQGRGFADHKIKVGGLAPELDAERVAAAAGVIGGGGRLALDANNAYRTVKETLRAVRMFQDAAGPTELWWIEEPLAPDDIAGHAELARRLETPVATGEIAQTRWEFRALIEQQAADILQPDAGVLGGVSEWMRAARTAESFGITVAPHWHANLHVHLAAAAPNCIAVEHFALEKDIYNFETLVTPQTRLQVRDGTLSVPDRPGLGIEFDPAQVQKFTVD